MFIQGIKKNLHIPILNADFLFIVLGMARLFGPDILGGSVDLGLIQQYCSTRRRSETYGAQLMTKSKTVK